MAVSQIALSRHQPTKFESGIQEIFLESAPLLRLIPKVTNGSLQGRWRRLLTLPTIGTRRLYQAFTESKGGWDTQSFDVPIYGGLLRIDEQLLTEPGGPEEWGDQIELYSQAMAFQMTKDAILGDRAVTPDAMDGLKVQIAAAPARMTITPIAPGDLDLTTPTLRDTNGKELTRLMDLAFQRVRQGTMGNPDLILMDGDLYNLMADSWRRTGYLTTTKDSIGREYDTYKGAKIVEAGFTYAEALTQTDANNAIMGSNFDGDGKTSMLFLRTGAQYVRWVQKHDLKVTEGKANSDGSSDDEMVVRVKKVEHPITIHNKHPYGAARLKGIKIA